MDALGDDGQVRMVLTLDIQGHTINPQTGTINQDSMAEGTLVFSIAAVPDLLDSLNEITIQLLNEIQSAE
jgi:hypothetical protein